LKHVESRCCGKVKKKKNRGKGTNHIKEKKIIKGKTFKYNKKPHQTSASEIRVIELTCTVDFKEEQMAHKEKSLS
jgi:RAB protein geranylgeranyltransferase component A